MLALTPEQQMNIAFLLHGSNTQQPQTQDIFDVVDWIRGHTSAPTELKHVGSTTYYPQPSPTRPQPNDEYYRRIAAEHWRAMHQAVQQFGGDTPASRQQYRQNFFERRALGAPGLPPTGYSAWVRKPLPIKPL